MLYNKSEDYKTIDLFKFIMAILVVAIHTNPIYGIHNNIILIIYKTVTNVAVPYFFIASSFLIFKKMNSLNNENKLVLLRKHIFKLIRMYIIWNLIYFPITIFGFFYDKTPVFVAIKKWFKGLLFIGEQFYSWPLWYILASIYIYSFIYIFIKCKMSDKFINVIFLLLYCLGFVISLNIRFKPSIFNTFYLFITNLFLSGRIFLGFGYALAGKIIASKSTIKIKNYFCIVTIMFLLLSVIFIKSNVYILFDYLLIGIFTFLFSFTLNNKINIQYKKLRFLSQVIYFLHMIIYFIYILLFKNVGYQGFDAFLITSLFSIFIGLYLYSNKNNFKILKIIF